jgi:hypothetical protein
VARHHSLKQAPWGARDSGEGHETVAETSLRVFVASEARAQVGEKCRERGHGDGCAVEEAEHVLQLTAPNASALC